MYRYATITEFIGGEVQSHNSLYMHYRDRSAEDCNISTVIHETWQLLSF